MPPVLSDKHFEVFGKVAYAYASVEVGFKICLAGILNTTTLKALTIAAPYGAYQLNSVVKSLAKDHLKPIWAERLCSLVNRWESFTAVRTAVAHHRWRAGTRPGSVRPTHTDVKSGEAKIRF